jgi:hypothetical protein
MVAPYYMNDEVLHWPGVTKLSAKRVDEVVGTRRWLRLFPFVIHVHRYPLSS